jgi:hypothetical protein
MTKHKTGLQQGTWWKPKDGPVLKIRDMDDQHLRNSLKMLRRSYEVWLMKTFLHSFAGEAGGDMAQDMKSMEEEAWLQDPPTWPLLESLEQEVQRRGLQGG